MASDNEKLQLLINQLQQSSQLAFTQLYDLYSRQLYRNILRLVRDDDIAQELLQDLFLKIWEKRHSINAESSFKSYLYKIAENLVYGHFRKITADKRLKERLIMSSTAFDTFAEETIITKENNELLKNAIESLPPQRRQVYTLCKLEGKSYEEVSLEMGIATSTVRNQIVQANKALREYLKLNDDLLIALIITGLFRHIN
ncbi:RNA polymerase sigma factor [Mucilaginibacter terrae]|uniref:RNA polymerase sigma factor n=1 Tax=Mucilaginibacter terrae TaxID=1955052 RepID=UPI00363E603B